MGIDISALNGATANTTGASTGATDKKNPLDREAFLKLLVAQLQHQDPMQPTQGTEFVAQLSQFAMVEQSVAQTSKLDILSTQMGGIASNEATSLVGKQVTLKGNGIAFDGLMATGAGVTLSGAAQSVQVTIKDSTGRAVRTLDLGNKPAGALAITWDGKDNNGQPVAAGKYQYDVKATGANGAAVSTSQEVTSTVTKVNFDKGYPELVLATGTTAPISDLISVGTLPTP